MLSDSHIHTHFSGDSDAQPREMIEVAIEKGLKSICFTDHEDIDYVCDGIEFVFDKEEYFRTMSALKDIYEDRIEIRIGVETGLQPHLGEKLRGFTGDHPFDYVIGSVHVVKGKDPYYKEFFENRSDEEAYREVLEETMKDIRLCTDFDSLGHLDYAVRYGRNREEQYSYRRFADQIDEILCWLIGHGKGLELNTAGLKYGLPFAHPHPDVLKRYRELGGEIITIGSDAHKAEYLAYAFDKVSDLMKSCGFKYYTEFKGRKPVFRKIP